MKKKLFYIIFMIVIVICLMFYTVEKISKKDFMFSLNGNSYTLVRYAGNDKNVNIPGYYLGRPVTEIATLAFYENDIIIDVTIPSTVKKIGSSAFYSTNLENVKFEENSQLQTIGDGAFSYTNLSEISIPSQVNQIGENVFMGNNYLSCINVNEDNEFFSSFDCVLFNSEKTHLIKYPNNKVGELFGISSDVNLIEQYALESNFLQNIAVDEYNKHYSSDHGVLYNKYQTVLIKYPNNKQEDSFVILDTVTQIENDAFSNLKHLKTLYIPSKVVTLSSSSFRRNNSLEEITVDENNENFSSIDGVLYDKNKTILIAYPNNKMENSFTVPSSVTTIDHLAFHWNKVLNTLIIPNSVTKIGVHAFSYSNNLEKIIINNTTPPSLSEYVFYKMHKDFKIVVPNSAIDNYTSKWGFKDHFQTMNELESISE